jgi:hypothetical protein
MDFLPAEHARPAEFLPPTTRTDSFWFPLNESTHAGRYKKARIHCPDCHVLPQRLPPDISLLEARSLYNFYFNRDNAPSLNNIEQLK